MPGFLVGYGTFIRGPLRIKVIGKSILWEEFTQYKVELEREFKKWEVSTQWNHFKDYHEISVRVGIDFSWRRLFRKPK